MGRGQSVELPECRAGARHSGSLVNVKYAEISGRDLELKLVNTKNIKFSYPTELKKIFLFFHTE